MVLRDLFLHHGETRDNSWLVTWHPQWGRRSRIDLPPVASLPQWDFSNSGFMSLLRTFHNQIIIFCSCLLWVHVHFKMQIWSNLEIPIIAPNSANTTQKSRVQSLLRLSTGSWLSVPPKLNKSHTSIVQWYKVNNSTLKGRNGRGEEVANKDWPKQSQPVRQTPNRWAPHLASGSWWSRLQTTR